MPSISSFNIISVVVPDPIFLCIFASAAASNPNGIKTLLANGLITFFINGNPVFNNGPKSLLDCIILDNSVFDSLIQFDELLVEFYEDLQLVY